MALCECSPAGTWPAGKCPKCLHRALVAERDSLRARVAALEGALEECLPWLDDIPLTNDEYDARRVAGNRARALLCSAAGKEDPDA